MAQDTCAPQEGSVTLEERVLALCENAKRQNAYLQGLRDAIGLLASRLTGENLEVLLPTLERRWTPDPELAYWVTTQDRQSSANLPETEQREMPGNRSLPSEILR